jgi:outer membrane protein OmpA-like peptidoglycan-associated protein
MPSFNKIYLQRRQFNHMTSASFLWVFCIYCSFFIELGSSQSYNSINIYGTCYDISTGVDLKIKAYSINGAKKILLGESNDLGKFNFQVPISTKYIAFNSEGFKSAVIPVDIPDGIESGFKFRISIPMSDKDSSEVEPISQLSLSLIVQDSVDVFYKLRQINNLNNSISFVSKAAKRLPNLVLKDLLEGDYILTAASPNGSLLYTEEVLIKPGLVFKSIVVAKDKKTFFSDKKISDNFDKIKISNYSTLYFSQSSYELNTYSKSTLDSISLYLSTHPSILITVTGYTDNVGEKDLNVILSEYRARTVANYLRQKGVHPNKISVKWHGPDSPVSSNELEKNKIKNRRVVINLSEK